MSRSRALSASACRRTSRKACCPSPSLARFVAAHPAVRVEVSVERSETFRDGTDAGRFALALFWDMEATDPGRLATDHPK